MWGQLLRANTRLEVILELFNRSGDWWQFVGPVWLKPTLTVWNFLLSWFNTGSTCWKMYMQPMTFSLCILPSSPCSRVSSFSRAWGRTNVSVSSKKVLQAASVLLLAGFILVDYGPEVMCFKFFLTESVKQVAPIDLNAVVLPDATAISEVSVVDASPNHMNSLSPIK